MAQKFIIKLRRDTGANWASVNPVLANGEPGYNTTTNQIKMGDGTTAWSSLPYLSAESGNIILNGTSNVAIPATNGNITMGVNGNANVVVVSETKTEVKGNMQIAGNSVIDQDLYVAGDLFVGNNLTTINQTTITVQAPMMYLNNDATGDTEDTGMVGMYNDGSTKYTGIVRDASDGVFKFFSNLGTAPTTTVDFSDTNIKYANIKAGNLLIEGGLTLSGNITANNITANFFHGDGSNLSNVPAGNRIVNGTSNIIAEINGNINFSANGTANVVQITDTNVFITGNLAVSGKTNLGAVGNVTITGGTSGQYLQTDGAGAVSWQTANATQLANGISSIAIPVAGGNIKMSVGGTQDVIEIADTEVVITGNLTTTDDVTASDITATSIQGVISSASAAQPNITSVGTLTGLNVDGDATFTNSEIDLGPVANLRITGGVAGQILTNDGSDKLTWTSPSAQSIEGWVQSNAYGANKVVRHLNALWSANDNIPAGTAFAIGTTGATWTAVDQTMGLTLVTITDLSLSTTLNASTTVDVATAINVPQTTSGIRLTLPTPTDATRTRTLFLNNTGTSSILVHDYTLNPGWSVVVLWTGSAWSLAVPDPNNATWTFADDASGVTYSGLSGTAFTTSLSISTFATATVSSGANGFVTGALTGAGRYIAQGGGNVIHTGVSSFTGNITIGTNTTLRLQGGAKLGGISAIYANSVVTNGTLNYQSLANSTFQGVFSGVGGVTMNSNAYTVNMTANSTYTGPTVVQAGNLIFGTKGQDAGWHANASSVTVLSDNATAIGTIEYRSGSTTQFSRAGQINGNGNVWINGSDGVLQAAGDWTTTDFSSFSGNLIITGARFGRNQTVGQGKIHIRSNGQMWLSTSGAARTITNDFYLNSAGWQDSGSSRYGAIRNENGANVTFSGNMNLEGYALVQTIGTVSNTIFTGNLIQLGSTDTVIGYRTPNTSVIMELSYLSSNNTGYTYFYDGKFFANTGTSLNPNSVVEIQNAANVNFMESSNIGGLIGSSSTVAVVASSKVLTVGNKNVDTSFQGSLTQTGTLTKIGTGTQTITANVSGAGATIINAGAITFGSNAASGGTPSTGAITIASGANMNIDTRYLTGSPVQIGSRVYNGSGNIYIRGGQGITDASTAQLNAGTMTNFNGNIIVGADSELITDASTSNSATAGTIYVRENGGLLLNGSSTFNTQLDLSGNGFLRGSLRQGALYSSTSKTISSNINLSGNTKIVSTSGSTTTLSGNITQTGTTPYQMAYAANNSSTTSWVITGNNSYLGNTLLLGQYTSATFQFNSPNSIPANSNVVVSNAYGGSGMTTNSNVTMGSLAGDSGTAITLSAPTANGIVIKVGNANINTVVNSTIYGNGGISKQGTGTMIITTNSSYVGVSQATGGILQFGSGGSTGAPGATSTLNPVAPGAISFRRNDTAMSITSVLTGNGNIEFDGSGTAGQSAYTLSSSDSSGFTGYINIKANAKLSTATAYAAAIPGVNVHANGQLYIIGVSPFATPLTIAGNGWLEANSTREGAIKVSGGTVLTSPITVTSTSMITAVATGTSNVNSTITGTGVGMSFKSVAPAVLSLTGTSTYDGNTYITGNTLATSVVNANSATAIPANSNINITSTMFNVNENLTAGLIDGTGDFSVASGKTFKIGGQNRGYGVAGYTNNFQGRWQAGTGNLEKIGTGNIHFNSGYTMSTTGNLVITDGVLTLGSTTNTPTISGATINVGSLGTLQYIYSSPSSIIYSITNRIDGSGKIVFRGGSTSDNRSTYSLTSLAPASTYTGEIQLVDHARLLPGTLGAAGAANIVVEANSGVDFTLNNTLALHNYYLRGNGIGNTAGAIAIGASNVTVGGNIFLESNVKIYNRQSGQSANINAIIQDGLTSNNTITFATVSNTSPIKLNSVSTYSGRTVIADASAIETTVINALPTTTRLTFSNSGSKYTFNANATVGNIAGGDGTAVITAPNNAVQLTWGNTSDTSAVVNDTYIGSITGGNLRKVGANSTSTIVGSISTTGSVSVVKGNLVIGNGVSSTGDITAASEVNVSFGGNVVYWRNDTAFTTSRKYTGTGNVVFKGVNQAGKSSYKTDIVDTTSTLVGNVYVHDGARMVMGSRTFASSSTAIIVGYDGTNYSNAQVLVDPTANITNKLSIAGYGWAETNGARYGALRIDGNATWSGAITLLAGDATYPEASIYRFAQTTTLDTTISGNISGSGNLAIYASTTSGNLVMSGKGTYTGYTYVNGTSRVRLSGNGGFSPSTVVRIDNGGVVYQEANVTIAGLTTISNTTNATYIIANATTKTSNLTIDVPTSTTSTWVGNLRGYGNLIKAGDGTFVLGTTTTSIYDNNVVANAGTLDIGIAGNVSAGTISIAGNLSIASGANVNIKQSLSGNNAGMMTIPSISGAGTLTFSGNTSATTGTIHGYLVNTTASGFTGTLNVNNGANIAVRPGFFTDGNPAITINDGATMYLSPKAELATVTTTGGWTVPTGVTKLSALVIGGGGGGGGGGTFGSGGGGQGGAGSIGKRIIDLPVTAGATLNFTIGGGGAGGTGGPISNTNTPPNTGTQGGNTVAFGFTSVGGYGGKEAVLLSGAPFATRVNNNPTGGVGGRGSVWGTANPGHSGGDGAQVIINGTTYVFGAGGGGGNHANGTAATNGGTSNGGGGGQGGAVGTANGANGGANSGSGGGGGMGTGSGTSGAGGNGAAGTLLIRWSTGTFQTITASSTVFAPAGATGFEYVLVGGGGGGSAGGSQNVGSSGSGGAGGEVVSGWHPCGPGSALVVTIGQGGAGSASVTSNGSAAGANGGQSTIVLDSETIATAAGGAGGNAANSLTQASIGSAAAFGGGLGTVWGWNWGQTGGTVQQFPVADTQTSYGSGGGAGGTNVVTTGYAGGAGGGQGGGGAGAGGNPQNGGNATTWGSGGGGGGGCGNTTNGGTGGQGGSGAVLIRYYKSSVASSFTMAGTGFLLGGARMNALVFTESSAELTGTMTLSAAASINVRRDALMGYTRAKISGDIIGTADLTINGATGSSLAASGHVTISNTNLTYSGTMIVNGQLRFTGSLPNGTIRVANGAKIAFSELITTPTTTASVRNLTLDAGSRFVVSSDGTSVGSVTVTNTLTATTPLLVDINTQLPTGTYTIIAYTGTVPTATLTTGTNVSGRTVTYAWVNGTGLRMTVA